MWSSLVILVAGLTGAQGFMRSRNFVPLSAHPTMKKVSLENNIDSKPPPPAPKPHPGVWNCTKMYYEQTTDHFNYSPVKGKDGQPGEPLFNQRYYFCSEHWRRTADGMAGPIFFYPGNEGNVLLYLNNTGLMWENAEKFGALQVFAEHRWYGETLPNADISYLTVEQAMADYVELVSHIKHKYNAMDAPVVAFGGSYGALLAGWLRLKYPGSFHGAIAASGPFLNYIDTKYTETFWQTTTYDATPEAGSAPACVPNVKATWPLVFKMAETQEGRDRIQAAFRTCENLTSSEQVSALVELVISAWNTMAMGNFPYPSSYLTGALSDRAEPLPAWPVRVACDFLKDETLADDPDRLFNAMREAAGVYMNATRDKQCFKLKSDFAGDEAWGYQTCTELASHGGYEAADGVHDMFFFKPDNMSDHIEYCKQSLGVSPNVNWHELTFGTWEDIALYGSNIVFSNGDFDPWYGAGILEDINPSLVAVNIKEGGHHVDLMFSDPADTKSIKKAREIEVTNIHKWVNEAYDNYRRGHYENQARFPGDVRAMAGLRWSKKINPGL
eukprot:comp24009_c0_seq1/m.42821 comp24009_c0_seq1/g.42821  ORF comp24009_c0_seq1/g.42821 comp24009_c0_seq1/m.42821 type:complete len:556 (-) comp24009_c0_seq1:545-2212(-)